MRFLLIAAFGMALLAGVFSACWAIGAAACRLSGEKHFDATYAAGEGLLIAVFVGACFGIGWLACRALGWL